MQCSQCAHEVSVGATYCPSCGCKRALQKAAASGFSDSGVTETAPSLPIYRNRYQLVRPLGVGGMGSVFLAQDLTLNRLVALKVINAAFQNHGEMESRFLQEVKTAQEVAHPNVVQVYELHADHNPPFIIMAYVEGGDLESLLAHNGLSLPEKLELIRQICQGLAAIHHKNITHRDLKPRNIMVRKNGEVLISDFGLAKSAFSPGLTAVGFQPGTLDYMSPEQLRGEPVDTRSDIYALGLVMFKILTGQLPDRGYSAGRGRDSGRALPKKYRKLVCKCLAESIPERYQTVSQILKDLEEVGRGQSFRLPVWTALAATTVLIMGVAGWQLSHRPPRALIPNKKVTVLIADFDNTTGKPVLESTLEPVTTLALEGAPFLNTFDRNQARKLAAEFQPGATKLDVSLANLVATRQGIDVVVDGSISSQGSGYSLRVRAIDPRNGSMLDSEQGFVGDEVALLGLVPKLVAPIRRKLGDSTPESTELAKKETFTAGSIEAAHSYAMAQQLQMRGDYQNALVGYLETIRLDSQMGRAYAGAATMFLNLDDRKQATEYFQQAMRYSSRMTERERHRTWGNYFFTDGSLDKAIEEYKALVAEYPFDSAGQANLAFAYFLKHDFQEALIDGRRAALEINPGALNHRNNYAFYALYAGDFDTAEREAKVVRDRNPRFTKAYVALALSQMAKGAINDATETYTKLQGLNTPDATYYAQSGLSDIAFYEGRLKDASGILRSLLTTEKSLMKKSKEQSRLSNIYSVLLDRELGPPAAQAAVSTTGLLSAGTAFESAESLLHLGRVPEAVLVEGRLASNLQPEQQLLSKLLTAERLRTKKSFPEALQLTAVALKLADSWLGRLEAGLIYLDAGMYPEAESEFENCLRRRGEATAVFLDDVPSFGYFPAVYYYLGCAMDGRGDPRAAEFYEKFLSVKKTREDPMVVACETRLKRQQSRSVTEAAQNHQ